MKQVLLVFLTLIGLTTGTVVAQTITSTPTSPVSVLPGGSFTITKGSSNWPSSGTYAITVTPSASGITLGSFSGSTGTVNISSAVAAGSYSIKLKRGSTTSTNAITLYVYTVNAGSDQTITLPTSSVSFSDASVGTSSAPAATYKWTQTSGPVTSTITTSTALNAGATGLTVAGTYVFRLTINGNSSLYNEVSITVATPPVATMSPSPVTIMPGSVSLTTSASNFSGSGNYGYSWSASPSNGVTVPGSTSTTSNSSTKSFSFTTTGTYVITATVTKGSGTATVNDTVYVVTSGTKSYGTPVYSANIKGGHVMIGNTVLAAASYSDNTNSSSSTSTIMNYFSVASDGTTSIYGNDKSDMEYVNIDNGATSGVYNSSAANLALPSGTNTIKFARLYWGGHLTSSDFSSANLTTVKIKSGTGNYGSVTIPATQVNVLAQTNGNGDTYYVYQAYADISNFIQSHGAGTYTVGNIPASTGKYSNTEGGAYGGWGITVAYENAALPSYYSVRIYDAFLLIAQNSSAQTVTLNNLNAPNNTLLSADAYLSTFAWEGDANLAASSSNNAGDYLQINGHTYSDAVNPATNMWNGTISTNGALVTTSNPSYKNQMGIDIDQINVGTNYGINANTTSVSVTFGTESDQYYPSVFAFSIKMKDPLVTINKTVTGSRSPVNSLFASETLTYVIAGQNTGAGDLAGATITDTLPSDITYVPGSMKIYSFPSGNAVTVTDNAGDDQAFITTTPAGLQVLTFYVGTGATKTGGGILAGITSDQYKVQFQATTPAVVNALTTVSNTAYVSGVGSQSGNLSTTITNQSTAIISPINSLPIVLTTFTVTKSGSDALLKWTTVTEKDNNHMDVQRSTDGVSFQTIGTVVGNGTTQLTHDYQYSDPIGGLSGILYYRLQIVDNDGKATYSTIVALRLDGSSFSTDLSVYPNPFVSNIKLNISSTKEINASVSIMNITGQRLSGTSAKLQNGSNVLVLDNLSKLQPGIYVIELVTEDGDKFYQKVVKQ